MGLNDSMSGYKKLKNEQGYSITSMYDQLKEVKFSFGAPSIGKISKKEAIVFEAIGNYQVYMYVTDKAIEVAKTLVTVKGKSLFKEIALSFVTDAQNKDAASVDRAVDEVYEVVKNLLETGTAVNKSSASATTTLYMKQKLIAITDKFSICTADEEPVYWVQGSLSGLNFSVQDTFGSELMEIKKKIVAITPEYTILKDDKKVGEIKKKVKLTRPVISGTVEGQDIEIKGDLGGCHYAILCNESVIGNIDTERLTWGDVYSIGIMDESKKDLIITIAIIVDNTLKNND